MGTNVTIRMLARKLQLSAATVSKALADSHEISEKTKQRVLALAAELDYSPNPYASGLRKKKTKTIAVVLPEVADSFFAQAIDGIESIAQEKGYHVLIRLTHENAAKERTILQDLRGGRADGVLLSVSVDMTDSSPIRELQEKGIPLVFFDRISTDIPTARVVTDDFESAYKATDHLFKNGCRRIALLSISSTLSISNQRMEGFKKALEDHSLTLRDSFFQDGPIQGSSFQGSSFYDNSIEGNSVRDSSIQGSSNQGGSVIQCSNDPAVTQELLQQLFRTKERPDGLIATVEKLIPPVYLACQQAGLSIPDQVKVIGFSNLPSAPLLQPSLTTITQPAFEMGRAAAAILFKALEKRTTVLSELQEVIPSILIPRGSTRI